LAVAAAAVAGSTAGVKVTVRPQSGSPGTRFVVRFRAPARTGVIGVQERRYQIQAHGKGTNCAQGAGTTVPPTRKGQQVSIRLSSLRCVATYHGKVTETIGPHCVSGQPCPLFASHIRTIARFTFAVVKSSGTTSSDTTPPTFAGLQQASQCFPGPQTPGEQQPVSLSWSVASDNASPSSQITYDIYMASSAGGENFSQPNWTTHGVATTQGTLGFTTPSLPAGRFFVVRARDTAGNEDHNTVERQAQNPCL
jgi:hypothetical protein